MYCPSEGAALHFVLAFFFCFLTHDCQTLQQASLIVKKERRKKNVATFLLSAFNSNKRGKETKSTSSIYPDLCCSVIRRTEMLIVEEQHRNCRTGERKNWTPSN